VRAPEKSVPWDVIEAAGKQQFGVPAENRRARPGGGDELLSPFQGCPIHGCPMGGAGGITISWMARHLE